MKSESRPSEIVDPVASFEATGEESQVEVHPITPGNLS